MSQLTPALNAMGIFTVRPPFTIVEGATYKVIAIRSLSDMAKAGVNVYQRIYSPVGLIDGAVLGSSTFSYTDEVALSPNIISLQSKAGDILYIPDTWITSYPDTSIVPYSQVILSISLGPLPDTVDLSLAQDAIVTAAQQWSGVLGTCLIHKSKTLDGVPLATSRTLELARQAAITATQTPASRIAELEAQMTLKDAYIASMISILQLNGIMPPA